MSQRIQIVPSTPNLSQHNLGDLQPSPGSYDVLMPSKTPTEFVLEILALAVGGALGSLLWKLIERWLDGDEGIY
jgi:hypothetical protein